MVAEYAPDPSEMSNRATKVPALKPNQLYVDWKKELRIWQGTNVSLGVEKETQAGTLFESLDGVPRQTVLSELTVEDIICEDGVANILSTLDNYFMGNATKNAFTNMDELMRYKCKPDTTMENFIVEFQMKVNKVKASGTVLPEGVLGYILLNAANLPEDKSDMVKATCDNFSYKAVKAQLEKIGLSKSDVRNKHFVKQVTSDIKVEPCFYGKAGPQHMNSGSSESSSDGEDLNGEKIFYASKRFSLDNRDKSRRFNMNPSDKFGHVRVFFVNVCTIG